MGGIRLGGRIVAGGIVPFILGDTITSGTPEFGMAVWDVTEDPGQDLTRISDRADTLNVATLEDPQPSPDGSQVVFSDLPIGAGASHVVIVDVATPPNTGSTLVTQTSLLVTSMQPYWHPAGTAIIYRNLDDSPNEGSIRRVNPDGSGITILKTINRTSGDIYRPRYNRNGNYIAYGMTVSGNDQIWVMNADGTGAVQVATITGTDIQCGVMFAWSPTADVIAYSDIKSGPSRLEIRKVNADGTGDTLLYSDTLPWWGLTSRPWKPDGTGLIYFRRDLGSDPRFRLYSVDASGGGATVISPDRTSFGGECDDLAYIFGSRIYWRENDSSLGSQNAIIVSCALDGSDKRTEFDCSPPPAGYNEIRWSTGWVGQP